MNDRSQAQAVRILLVEDNDADIYLFRRALKTAELSAEVTVISDGAAALAFVRSGEVPDIAVLDMNLRKHGVCRYCRRLARGTHWFEVPIAVMSSSTSPAEQAMTAELRATRYIRKPLDLDSFLRIGNTLKDIQAPSECVPAGFDS